MLYCWFCILEQSLWAVLLVLKTGAITVGCTAGSAHWSHPCGLYYCFCTLEPSLWAVLLVLHTEAITVGCTAGSMYQSHHCGLD